MTEKERYCLHTDIVGNCFIVNDICKFGMFDKLERSQVIRVIDELNSQDERIKELEKENEKLKQRIEEETDRVIKLEQYVYTKLCPKSEHYDEKVLSEIINTILSDIND